MYAARRCRVSDLDPTYLLQADVPPPNQRMMHTANRDTSIFHNEPRTTGKMEVSRIIYRLTAALVCSPLLVGQVMAQESGGLSGFRTPTNNIHCMLNDFEPTPDNPISLRCDIRETDNRLPRRPRSCDLEWGTTFAIATEGRRGELWCVGDTTFDEKHTVLEYGHFWQKAGFTCRSEQSGVTCFNSKMHGFLISRTVQKLF